jgi:fibronectin type 3 domain-containing protein
LTLVDLQPDTSYKIRVQAVDSKNNQGKSSTVINVHTKAEDVEIGQVRNLHVHVLGPDSVQVEWDAPNTLTERAFRYKLFYRRLNTGAEEEEIQSVVVKTSYALHSLRKNSEYSVRVQVVDANGAVGKSSGAVNFHTYPDVPDAPPTNIKVDAPEFGSIRIKWSPPPVEDQNGNLTSYKIRYKTKGRSSKSLIAVANADSNEHTITGLDSGVIYQIRIAAQNQVGTNMFGKLKCLFRMERVLFPSGIPSNCQQSQMLMKLVSSSILNQIIQFSCSPCSF